MTHRTGRTGPPCGGNLCLRHTRTSKPYDCFEFGVMDVTKPYEFIWFGDIHGPEPYKFIGLYGSFISQTLVVLKIEAAARMPGGRGSFLVYGAQYCFRARNRASGQDSNPREHQTRPFGRPSATRRADCEAFSIRTRPKSCTEARFLARKHYCVTSGNGYSTGNAEALLVGVGGLVVLRRMEDQDVAI